ATLAMTMIPNTFSVSSTAESLMLQDADNDTGLNYLIDTGSATLTWALNDVPLTEAQLSTPLGDHFAGKTLSLTMSAPVTISSTTGLPTTAAPLPVSTTITVQVDAPDALSLSLDSDSAYVEGGSIMMTVTASKEGVPIPGAVISFATTGTVDRQGNTSGWTGSNGPLQLNAANIGSRTFTTGDNGRVDIPVTHPRGLGVKTTIEATAVPGVTATTDVTFAIVTSPDTPLANMFGHMSETVTADGMTFKRPNLHAEIAGDLSGDRANETWAAYNYASAIGRVCGSETKLPSRVALEALYAAYPNSGMNSIHGWPILGFSINTSSDYRSSTVSVISHYSVSLVHGFVINGNADTGNGYVSCHP
ncbi:TPA: DUF823 domain-containing adhesin, partial [Serratia fonticola]